jgi:hypothetical protein
MKGPRRNSLILAGIPADRERDDGVRESAARSDRREELKSAPYAP